MTNQNNFRTPNSELRTIIVKFLKFGIVGASGMVVDYGVLFLMHNILDLNDILSNTISFTCAATSNYFLNRWWTFRSQEKQVGVEYAKFLAVSIVGLLINNGVLLLCKTVWPVPYEQVFLCIGNQAITGLYLFKLLAIAVTTLWNFFGNMLFTFRKAR